MPVVWMDLDGTDEFGFDPGSGPWSNTRKTASGSLSPDRRTFTSTNGGDDYAAGRGSAVQSAGELFGNVSTYGYGSVVEFTLHQIPVVGAQTSKTVVGPFVGVTVVSTDATDPDGPIQAVDSMNFRYQSDGYVNGVSRADDGGTYSVSTRAWVSGDRIAFVVYQGASQDGTAASLFLNGIFIATGGAGNPSGVGSKLGCRFYCYARYFTDTFEISAETHIDAMAHGAVYRAFRDPITGAPARLERWPD